MARGECVLSVLARSGWGTRGERFDEDRDAIAHLGREQQFGTLSKKREVWTIDWVQGMINTMVEAIGETCPAEVDNQ